MATKKAPKKEIKARFEFSLNGKRIAKGEVITVSEEKAKSLVERGFCEEV
jgi:hypothetical protein